MFPPSSSMSGGSGSSSPSSSTGSKKKKPPKRSWDTMNQPWRPTSSALMDDQPMGDVARGLRLGISASSFYGGCDGGGGISRGSCSSSSPSPPRPPTATRAPQPMSSSPSPMLSPPSSGGETTPKLKIRTRLTDGLDLRFQPVGNRNPLRKFSSPRMPQKASGGQTTTPEWLGFPNTGNTCYLNAVLQCLFSVPSFASDIRDWVPPRAPPANANNNANNNADNNANNNTNNNNNGDDDEEKENRQPFPVMVATQRLLKLKEAAQKSGLELALKSFKNAFTALRTDFRGFHQHDAQEFLLQYLEILEREWMESSNEEVDGAKSVNEAIDEGKFLGGPEEFQPLNDSKEPPKETQGELLNDFAPLNGSEELVNKTKDMSTVDMIPLEEFRDVGPLLSVPCDFGPTIESKEILNEVKDQPDQEATTPDVRSEDQEVPELQNEVKDDLAVPGEPKEESLPALNKVQEPTASSSSKSKAPTDLVSKNFSFRSRTTHECNNCNQSTEMLSDDRLLSLSLREDRFASLAGLVESALNSKVEGRKCEHCKQAVDDESRSVQAFTSLPRHLVLNLLRTGYSSGEPVKSTVHVDVPLTLDLERFVSAEEAEKEAPASYKLTGVVNHMGTMASSGHYTADILTKYGWHRYDDQFVESVDDVMVISGAAVNGYLFFYERSAEE